MLSAADGTEGGIPLVGYSFSPFREAVLQSYKMTMMLQDDHSVQPLRVAKVAAPVRAEVLHKLRDAIIRGHFAAGDRLVERELCEQTGVSRTSIREALRQLESEGLVTTVPNKGVVVAGVSRKEAFDIYYVRELLESAAARLFVANATEADIRLLEEAVEEFQVACRADDLPGDLTVKARFYEILVGVAGNGIIAQTLKSLHARVTALRAMSMRMPGRPAESLEELREIVAAIKRRDADAAAAACAYHVHQAGRWAMGDDECATAETGRHT